jgi:hypothetical protein
VRVTQAGCHVEAELVIVVHVGISDLNQLRTTLNNDLLLKDGIKKWIDFVFNLFDKYWIAFHERELESILQAWVVKSEDAVLLNEFSFSSLDPRNGLTLRIDHEWVSGGPGDHDTILDGELISGKTLKVPITNSCVIDEELVNLHIIGCGNAPANKVIVE